MAKYEVNYSCGHSAEIQLFGPTKARYRKIEWLEESGVCPECYKAQKDAERAAATQKAAEEAKSSGLPELIGSEKQVAWAESIRNEALNHNNKINDDPQIIADQPEEKQEEARRALEILITARKRLEVETSAKWWIDNRDRVNNFCYAAYRQEIKKAVAS